MEKQSHDKSNKAVCEYAYNTHIKYIIIKDQTKGIVFFLSYNPASSAHQAKNKSKVPDTCLLLFFQ